MVVYATSTDFLVNEGGTTVGVVGIVLLRVVVMRSFAGLFFKSISIPDSSILFSSCRLSISHLYKRAHLFILVGEKKKA